MIQLETYSDILGACASHGAQLVAVSKSKTVADIQELYDQGQRAFGENRVQELQSKRQQLPGDIEWHLIGHLQTNKVRHAIPDVSIIQSVDSRRLMEEIDRRAAHAGRLMDCLLQVHIAREETKFGFSQPELEELLSDTSDDPFKAVRICGLMGMATLTRDDTQVRSEFRGLRTLFDELKRTRFAGRNHFTRLSMGMSSDYRIALEEGSTMIRVGSLLFGER